jgi:hypothetical protein
MGAVTSLTCANWNQNGDFTLTITDGGRPDSVIPGVQLSLRSLVSGGYTIFEQQSSGGDMVNSAGAEGFFFAASGFSGLAPVPTSMNFDDMGAVTSLNCAFWNQNGFFTLTATDGGRPDSIITGITLKLRSIGPEPLLIEYDGDSGSIVLQVEGDTGLWDWFGYSEDLDNSVLYARDSIGASSFTIHWSSGGLEPDESGHSTFTINPSGSSQPSSTIELLTIITGYDTWNLPEGLQNSLESKMDNSFKSIENGNDKTAVNQLNALINAVNGQSGKKINIDSAEDIIAAVEKLIINIK